MKPVIQIRKPISAYRTFFTALFVSLVLCFMGYGSSKVYGSPTSNDKPNIIIINADDMGYGDLSCYSQTSINTPNIDKMAKEGMQFTDAYASSPLCSPSRFGLLTGRYAQRVGINHVFYEKKKAIKLGRFMANVDAADLKGAKNHVDGIPEEEATIAELLKEQGYRTALIGKWHLGNFVKDQKYNPLNHGFDYFYGVPYSNANKPLPLYRGMDIIQENFQGQDQAKLTGLYTQESIEFIKQSKEKPFFLYLAHTFPHKPLFASEKFRGKSKGGLYGDTVEELDWSTGTILDFLQQNGLAKNTLVIFTSDNGPWYEGSPGPLRGRKGEIYDGGFRVPMIAWWPGNVPSQSTCTEPVMNIDFLPTFLSLSGGKVPTDRPMDGKNIAKLLLEEGEKTPHEALYFFHHDQLQGIRVGNWKLYLDINTYVYPLPVTNAHSDFMPKLYKKLADKISKGPYLYDMKIDPGENYNLASNFPEVTEKLTQMMNTFRTQMNNIPKE